MISAILEERGSVSLKDIRGVYSSLHHVLQFDIDNIWASFPRDGSI